MAVLRDRITVVDRVYHQRMPREADSFEYRFSRELKTIEQCYSRECVATEEWQSLDHGWISKAGMLIVANSEGKFSQVNPSKEEREAVARKVLEMAYRDASGLWLVPPGESFRGMPEDVTRLTIRCRSGSANFTVHVLPA